ncbi:MAG: Trm112 family protein [Candidatus ainarchaeum sp.]|nr:Trm112 family protein [Candidatus ainarchaeum sp.]
MELNKKLLEVIACPKCKGTPFYNKKEKKLVCEKCGVEYKIESNIPIMLSEKAEKIN